LEKINKQDSIPEKITITLYQISIPTDNQIQVSTSAPKTLGVSSPNRCPSIKLNKIKIDYVEGSLSSPLIGIHLPLLVV
jgi:hypothetical protein